MAEPRNQSRGRLDKPMKDKMVGETSIGPTWIRWKDLFKIVGGLIQLTPAHSKIPAARKSNHGNAKSETSPYPCPILTIP